mmetsp:Transcript_8502/g.26172  ORF Transcript_8502/g.26172 Transcript_8502/m.26172 type:complete len:118 (+) Transcript_8502:164-517(+)
MMASNLTYMTIIWYIFHRNVPSAHGIGGNIGARAAVGAPTDIMTDGTTDQTAIRRGMSPFEGFHASFQLGVRHPNAIFNPSHFPRRLWNLRLRGPNDSLQGAQKLQRGRILNSLVMD